MKTDNESFNKYVKLKAEGKNPAEVFQAAKNDGYKNFECINLLMKLFDLSLNDARQISHNLFLKKD